MVTLSLCMIVKNEEDVLARCLSCLKDIVDEIIIVDTGSTDQTVNIASQFTENIYSFQWCNDFAMARNESFSKASMDYVMWLDADDILTPINQHRLLELKQTLNPEVDIVMMKYDVDFDSNDNPTFSYYRERIFKRSENYQWIGEIHEVIPQRGNVIFKDIAVRHKKIRANEPERNLKIFQKMLADGKTLDPRQQYYYARELFYNRKYNEAVSQFTDFLLEGKGWIENNISACRDLARCYYAMNEPIMALEALLKSLVFDAPRAEVCCEIGKYFLDKHQYQTAVFWYETAASCKMNIESGAFCETDCYGYLPCIQLCVCYDKLGNRQKAIEYNDKAGQFKPDNRSYLLNKEYFNKSLT